MTEPIFAYEPREFAGFDELIDLALDLRWSWDHSADDIWRPLDPEMWDLTRNPWMILETISPEKLEQLSAEPAFRTRIEKLAQELHESRSAPGWFQKNHAGGLLETVAYFSMEFMLSEALPIYSGGLGNVAGDQLKAASDLGVPVVGVGLLYQEGYFRQSITADGSQLSLYPYNDPGQLQITPARGTNGEWVRLKIRLPAYDVWVRAWEAQVGRLKLYLLDTNDPANLPIVRGITGQLYGGGLEMRIVQELVLGIGGWRLLRALGLDPEVCHLNEGHAAFAVLERAADFMKATGHPFSIALQATRAGNLFTTHTPVAAGFDRFPPNLVRQYLGSYAENELSISFRDLMALGRQNPDDDHEPFNMAYLAIRASGAVNGVSRLHGKVSRGIFQSLFPRWPQDEVPIGCVTNGIHVPTWDSKASDALWTKHCGKDRWRDETEMIEEAICRVSDEELWSMRQASRSVLVEHVRNRYARQLIESGGAPDDITRAKQIFNPEVLTLGFARRFATYKRPTLLLHDPERLVRILTNPEHPVQLILAGKAHPADLAGQDMIREWVQFTCRPEVSRYAVFLSDYDMLLTEQLVGGVDVWINTPRRPWEACGTSGMKVLANGGLNLSELDGWWAEGYSSEVGWALGDRCEHGDDPAWDAMEAEALYTLLEKEVVPQFYIRDGRGIPTQWITKMHNSIETLTAHFSANRAVRQYTNEYYVPAATAYKGRCANNGQEGVQILNWKQALIDGWRNITFEDVHVETHDGRHHFKVQVRLGKISPGAVSVELYADAPDGGVFHEAMALEEKRLKNGDSNLYTAAVPATRPAADFTPRIIPRYPGVSVPLEINLILWQH